MCLQAWNNYCWCETQREPGHVNFPHDWKHLAVGNSLIVPHKKTKEGQAEDGAPLRKNSNEMWSCFLQIQHIFEKRKTEAGPVAIDLRCASLQAGWFNHKHVRTGKGWHIIQQVFISPDDSHLQTKKLGAFLVTDKQIKSVIVVPSHPPSAAHQLRPSACSTWRWPGHTQWWRWR